MRIQLLGPPLLEFNSENIPFSARPKVWPLLGYLLLHSAAPVHRERIASALWTNDTDSAARTNLRRHLHYLHALLPAISAEPWILSTAQSVQWNSRADYLLDVDEFSRRAADPAMLTQAVEIYAGNLMEGTDEPWLVEPRRQLEIRYASCLLDLIAQHRARRSHRKAQAYARKLLAFDPWHEDAVRALLVSLYEAGDGAGAVSEFHRFALTLKEEMGTEPMAETVAVFRAIQSGIPPPGASPPALPTAGREITEPALVARAGELEHLSNAWRAIASGDSHSVTVSGEAGIGKSRLAREAALSIESQGGLTVFGSTSYPESWPYQSLAAIVRSLCSLVPKLRIDPLWLCALCPLAPEIRAQVPELVDLPPMDSARERARLFEAAAVFFQVTAKHRPLCIILEDLHWAGSATLELCAYLVHRLRRSRVLWLFTWREEAVLKHSALRELRAKLTDTENSNIRLRPLEREECAQLLPGNSSLNERLYTYSGGNPLYFLELARNPQPFTNDTVRLPEALRESVLARSAELSERAQTLLQVAAVVGTTFDLDLLSGVTGWSEVQCLDVLSELVDNHLVQERSQSLSFSFSHQLIAAATYASIDEVQRTRRHRRVAHVLELLRHHRPEFHAAIARHFDKADDGARASEVYVQAASYSLSLYANSEAVNYATRALQLAQADLIRFSALDLLLRVVTLDGRRDEQARLTDQLLETASRLQGADRCHALRKKIDLANAISDHDAQRLLISRLEEEAARCSEPRWQASALEARAKLLRSTGEFAAENECFAQLERLIDRGADRVLYAEAYLSHADALVYQGRLSEARQIIEDVRKSLDARTNRTLLIRALMSFSRAALAVQDYASMSDFAAQAYEISNSIGDLEGEALSLHNLANGLVYTFRVTEARDAYTKTIALYERLGHQIGLASVYVDYALFHTELGLLEEAGRMYERALSIAESIDLRFVVCVGNVNLSYCERLRGNFAAAKVAATRAMEAAEFLSSSHLMSAALGVLGAAETELDEVKSAISHLKQGVELRRSADPSPRLGENLCALAIAHLRAANVEAARSAARELLALYELGPHLAPQPTQWLWAAAQVYATTGDDRKARDLEKRAANALETRAAQIPDDATRQAFLNLPFNRALRTRC